MAVDRGSSNNVLEIIREYMKDGDIKRDDDICDLFLGECEITDLNDLGRYRYLQHLWLHGNKLTQLCLPHQPHVSFVHLNFRLAELYLHDNDIKSISGMLHHLRSLKVLMLQKNQLDDLDETTFELKPMRNLQVLNMLYNPLSQVKGYRLHLIHHCPSVQLLDRHGVTANERKAASLIYEEKRNAVKAMIAFGRRTDAPPIFDAKPIFIQKLTISKLHGITASDQTSEESVKSLEQLVKERTRKKSIMQYTTMDWSLVPTRDRRIMGEVAPKPQNITVRFR